MENSKITVEEMCERFERIYTGAISDILDEMGYRNQVLPTSLKGLRSDTSLVGRALPVVGEVYASTDSDEIFIPILEMLGDVKKRDVIITQANDVVSAHLGELSATTAKVRGGAGAVIYGGVRDIDYILQLDFPVFCCYTTPADVLGRWRLIQYNVPIQIENTQINPGDYLVGDKDGVLVIPVEIAEEVLVKAEEVVSTENHVRKAVIEGTHPVDAYKKYGRF
jgi:4-hydroxy-4-methyl-2-oxoglutarate aldolase